MRPGDRLRRFHEAARQPSRPAATRPPAEEVRLRVRLLLEEALEAAEAMVGPDYKHVLTPMRLEYEELLATWLPMVEDPVNADLPSVAREHADLAFVTYGAAEHYGIDLDKALEIIADANMRKLPGCPNPHCRDGWIPWEPNESGGAPGAPCAVCGGTGKDPGRDRAPDKIAKPDDWEEPDLTWALRKVWRAPEDVPEITKQTAVGVDPATGGEKLIERTEES